MPTFWAVTQLYSHLEVKCVQNSQKGNFHDITLPVDRTIRHCCLWDLPHYSCMLEHWSHYFSTGNPQKCLSIWNNSPYNVGGVLTTNISWTKKPKCWHWKFPKKEIFPKKLKICKCAIGGMLQLNFIYRMYKIASFAVQWPGFKPYF